MTGKLYECCICGITDHGYGNNPDPIKKGFKENNIKKKKNAKKHLLKKNK